MLVSLPFQGQRLQRALSRADTVGGTRASSSLLKPLGLFLSTLEAGEDGRKAAPILGSQTKTVSFCSWGAIVFISTNTLGKVGRGMQRGSSHP